MSRSRTDQREEPQAPNRDAWVDAASAGWRGLRRASPPDWAYYSIAGLAVAGLVWAGMEYRPSGAEPIVTENTYVMNGPALSQLIPGPGTRTEFFAGPEGALARVSALASFEAAGRLAAGVGAVVPPEFEARVAGRLLRIEATLRGEPDNAPDMARLGYFTVGFGDSGWRDIAVGETFETVGFCYAVNPAAEINGDEAIGIWPDLEGRGRAVLLREFRVTIEPAGVTMGQCEAAIGG